MSQAVGGEGTAPPLAASAPFPLRGDVAGAVGDLGTFVPLAIALIVTCGLSATAVLAGAGAFYLGTAAVYRLPIPVQPMKAVSAIALAAQLSRGVLAAAGLLLGVILTLLGSTGVLDRMARLIPIWLVRAVQVAVGLALIKVAVGLVGSPPEVFTHQLGPSLAVPIALGIVGLCMWRPMMILPALVVGGVVTAVSAPGFVGLGPSDVALPEIGPTQLWDALVLLVLPQLPLTITSSCIATADAAEVYYGPRASRARPSALAQTIGGANLVGGLTGAMAMCHGSGGVSAHHAFGARTWRAPAVMGGAFLVLALVFGRNVVAWIAVFPLPLLVGLIGVVAVIHLRLLSGMPRRHQAMASILGVGGFWLGVATMVVGVAAALLVLHAVGRARAGFGGEGRPAAAPGPVDAAGQAQGRGARLV